MFFNFKNHFNVFLLLILVILVNCQLQEPLKTHGIIYLENRSQKLTIKKSNKNDVISVMGKPHILETALIADFAFVKAWKGDSAGNLIFKGTARNFNPLMAMAGKIAVAEVEELVQAGKLDPNQIHTPGIFVQRILQGEKYEKRIEQKTTRTRQ